MKLAKLKICNYRSFGDEQEIPIDKMTAFIGNNSAGKTTALSALNCIFSENSSDRLLSRSDFHVPKGQKPEDMEKQELYIETVFVFDELKNENGSEEYSIPPFFESMVVATPNGVPYMRIRLEATWEKSNNIEGSIESKIVYVVAPEEQEIREEDKKTVLRKDLDRIRVIYIPAVRDPAKQLKNVSGTMIHQIISCINWSDSTKENIEQKIVELNEQFKNEEGISKIDSSIHNRWLSYDYDKRYYSAQLRFNSTNLESSIKNSEVVFLPSITGKQYTIDEMGDGLRSLFYISMVDSILEVESSIKNEIEENKENRTFSKNPPLITIIALEEPENHIAPHLLGKLLKNLLNIADKTNAQTILTSHSSAIIKRVNPENIRYFNISDVKQYTEVRSITLPDKERMSDQYKFIKEAVKAYPELYFAKLVILGEGDSEEIIIPRYIEANNKDIDSNGISIVPLGGRHVNHFWRLLKDLNIPYITLLDLDRERNGGGWGRIKYVIKQLIERGIPKEELLNCENMTLDENELEEMDSWSVNETDKMKSWITKLEEYNVFFSSPLDIDFVMLETICDKYISILEEKEGPRLEIEENGVKRKIKFNDADLECHKDELNERIIKDVKSTLKECGGDGRTYSQEQKRLMIWYNYFFLNRGKPTTHIEVLSRMSDEECREHMPEVLKKIIDKIQSITKQDEFMEPEE